VVVGQAAINLEDDSYAKCQLTKLVVWEMAVEIQGSGTQNNPPN
jgi:hypothetical protein